MLLMRLKEAHFGPDQNAFWMGYLILGASEEVAMSQVCVPPGVK
jgi:hypothetical protein